MYVYIDRIRRWMTNKGGYAIKPHQPTNNRVIGVAKRVKTKILPPSPTINQLEKFRDKCPLGNCVSKENSAYVGLTTTTLFRRLTMHLNDSSSIVFILRTILFLNIYIVIHRQTVALYHNSSVWLDTEDAWSWDRNPPNYTLDLVSYCSANKRTPSAREL